MIKAVTMQPNYEMLREDTPVSGALTLPWRMPSLLAKAYCRACVTFVMAVIATSSFDIGPEQTYIIDSK